MRFPQVSFVLSSAFLTTVLSAQVGPLTIVSGLPTGAVGKTYAQVCVTGGLQPYTTSTTGQFPPGLAVNSVGVISGIPTVGGTYSFTLNVVDARQASVSKALSVVITGPGPSPLTVTTTTLPAGTVGQSYSQSLAATGGTPPYQWAAGTR